jgi:hypothetical protein
VRIVGAVGAILYGIAGIAAGLAQQRTGLGPAEIDCSYRAKLIRDRAVALTERSPQHRLRDPHDVVFTLIRETLAACAEKDAKSSHELEAIEALLRDYQHLRVQEAEARSELLAL